MLRQPGIGIVPLPYTWDMGPDGIPYHRIETVFLDVGNTLVSMDYRWIRDELEAQGVRTELERLERAEAAARPAVSTAIASDASSEGAMVFALYLKTIIENLIGQSDEVESIVSHLVPVFRGPGRERLWSHVLPGVPEALEMLRGLGLNLAVVSNSDGSVERVLTVQGLRPYLDAVFDSHLVGFEKPDPRFFQHALEQTGSRPETTLHVGDLYSADVEGGRAAGVYTALVDPYGDWEGANCPRFENLKRLAEAFRANVEP